MIEDAQEDNNSPDHTDPKPKNHFIDNEDKTVKAFIFNPVLRSERKNRTEEEVLAEASELARAIYLEVVQQRNVKLSEIKPKFFFGEGFVEEVTASIKSEDIQIIIVNHRLSPVQQRNLERAWKTKVIDRTGLILEIFGERAKTSEGKLQVKLASLNYQRSRLVRAWTHLERQRGGTAKTGGPGETQLELDRRQIDDQIIKIKKQLAEVKKTRHLHRSSRKKVPYPVVALIGYTNAGKSTLFNYLTGADVFAKDLLFATLDPTMRAVELPSKTQIILSDTVGFISDLPTQLVEAFKSTLEEVIEADVLLILTDIASPEYAAQFQDVKHVLSGLGIDLDTDERILLIANKIDLLSEEQRNTLDQTHRANHCFVSAVTGEGMDKLCTLIDEKLHQDFKIYKLEINPGEGKLMAWLHSLGAVLSETENPESGERQMKVQLSEKDFGVLNSSYKGKFKII